MIFYFITYANTIVEKKKRSFFVLEKFLKKYVKKAFSIVHILPFYPASSDGGFSVIDFFKIDERHGNWNDISKLAKDYILMVDIVLNHGSRQSEWFKNFKRTKEREKIFTFI